LNEAIIGVDQGYTGTDAGFGIDEGKVLNGAKDKTARHAFHVKVGEGHTFF
jgi:hypothetical protein